MPAAAVIPAPKAYIKFAAVKMFNAYQHTSTVRNYSYEKNISQLPRVNWCVSSKNVIHYPIVWHSMSDLNQTEG